MTNHIVEYYEDQARIKEIKRQSRQNSLLFKAARGLGETIGTKGAIGGLAGLLLFGGPIGALAGLTVGKYATWNGTKNVLKSTAKGIGALTGGLIDTYCDARNYEELYPESAYQPEPNSLTRPVYNGPTRPPKLMPTSEWKSMQKPAKREHAKKMATYYTGRSLEKLKGAGKSVVSTIHNAHKFRQLAEQAAELSKETGKKITPQGLRDYKAQLAHENQVRTDLWNSYREVESAHTNLMAYFEANEGRLDRTLTSAYLSRARAHNAQLDGLNQPTNLPPRINTDMLAYLAQSLRNQPRTA